MRIFLEDYFGNDVIKLEFCLRDRKVTNHQDRLDKIQDTVTRFGWSVADTDEDEQGEYVRVQQVHVIDDEVGNQQEKIDLLMMISNLTADWIS